MSRSSWSAYWSPETEWWRIEDEDTGLVATTYLSEENAHLISAAPDMKAALGKCLQEIVTQFSDGAVDAYRIGKDALAKANGDSSGPT